MTPAPRKWTISVGDEFMFQIVRDKAEVYGRFDTKLEAAQEALGGLLESRRALNEAIAKARRMVRYYSKRL